MPLLPLPASPRTYGATELAIIVGQGPLPRLEPRAPSIRSSNARHFESECSVGGLFLARKPRGSNHAGHLGEGRANAVTNESHAKSIAAYLIAAQTRLAVPVRSIGH